MRISIIVPAYNEERLLPATLQAIALAARAWDSRGWTHEVIVCDNASTDRTAQLAAAHGARVVFEPINQISRARNRGAEAATGRWLLFIDADSEPTAALFDDLAAAILTDRYVACGARLHFADAPLALRLAAGFWSAWSRLLSHMAGAFIAVETTAFREVGGFSETLFAAEELDLSHRLQHLGRDRYPAQRIHILTRHPLLTSGRKMTLYRPTETLRFLGRGLLRPGRVLRDREACHLWYDGRR